MTEVEELFPLAAEPARRRRLAVSTLIFGLATGLSRVLGLVREVIAATEFGIAGKFNAFTVAFQLPNLARALVADAALSSAFVPIFSELLEKGGEEASLARRLDALLVDAARAGSAHGALHPGRTAPSRPSGTIDSAPLRPALACPLPDRRPARRVGNHRRDPQQLRHIDCAGPVAGRSGTSRSSPVSSSAYRTHVSSY